MEQEVNITPFAYAMSLIGGKWKAYFILAVEKRSFAL